MSLARKVSRAKEPKRAPPCIFCDEPRGSKEHFWPEWMHPLLPTFPNPKYNREVIELYPTEGEKRSGRVGAQGGVQTIQIRAVCRTCNQGWMNDLEKAARPLLTPLILGEPVALDLAQDTTVARWIALKCIVSEHAAPNKALTPRADRERMKHDLTIPPHFRIYLAPHIGRHVAFRRHSHLVSLTRELRPPLPVGVSTNIQTITFFIGRVFVHVNAARIDDFDLESRVQIPGFYPEARIWPPLNANSARHQRRVYSRNDVEMISQTLQHYLDACKITWDPSPGV